MKHPLRVLVGVYVIFFAGWAFYLEHLVASNTVIALKIRLRDPRDLIYGQFLALTSNVDRLLDEAGISKEKLSSFFVHYSYESTRQITNKKVDVFKPDRIKLPPFTPSNVDNLREGFWIRARWRNGVQLGIEKFLFSEARIKDLQCESRLVYVLVRILRNQRFRLVDVVCAEHVS